MDFASLGVAPDAQPDFCAVMPPIHRAHVAFAWMEINRRGRGDECGHKYQHGKYGAGNLTAYKLK